MRGMMGGKRLVRTGAAPSFAVDGVAGDRMGAGRPSLARRWVSTMAENCADSKAGRGRKAPRSEVDGDATMSDARCAVSMTFPPSHSDMHHEQGSCPGVLFSQ